MLADFFKKLTASIGNAKMGRYFKRRFQILCPYE